MQILPAFRIPFDQIVRHCFKILGRLRRLLGAFRELLVGFNDAWEPLRGSYGLQGVLRALQGALEASGGTWGWGPLRRLAASKGCLGASKGCLRPSGAA